MKNNRAWRRICRGLYVDPSGKWIASNDAPNAWSLRVLVGWGKTFDGYPFPEYGHLVYGDGSTFAEVKLRRDKWGDDYPVNDEDLVGGAR